MFSSPSSFVQAKLWKLANNLWLLTHVKHGVHVYIEGACVLVVSGEGEAAVFASYNVVKLSDLSICGLDHLADKQVLFLKHSQPVPSGMNIANDAVLFYRWWVAFARLLQTAVLTIMSWSLVNV